MNNIHSQIRLRTFGNLDYCDPTAFLVSLRALEVPVALSATPEKIKTLRVNSLKEWREAREAALFCIGMGMRLGKAIYFARNEADDFDFVASWLDGDTRFYAPVQIKEVVPNVPGSKDIQSIVDGLTHYPDSKDLVVAIHLNQRTRFEPIQVSVPKLNIGSVWVFGSISEDQSKWCLWGGFMETVDCTVFDYPVEITPTTPPPSPPPKPTAVP